MRPSSFSHLLAIAVAALLLAFPISALAQPASNRDPVAHAAKRGPVAHAAKHHKRRRRAIRARCHTKRHKRYCPRAHKASHRHKRYVSHSSGAHEHLSPVASTPTPPTAQPPGPAGPVQAPTLTITGTTYYVSRSGSDSNSGTSPSSAWRTVNRVNRASLRAGDGVLFEGGATFSDSTLMPSVSGAAGSPVIFGSYGQGNAVLSQGVWFKGYDYLAFEHLTIGPEGNLQGTGDGVIVEWCAVGHDGTGINGMGSNWTIDDNTVDHTGNSGMLLEGENFTVSGNTITNTGLDQSISYGKHGIYLKVSNAAITNNTIANFSSDGISVRYRNSVLSGNQISGGPIGIGWFQYDPVAGISRWTENTITQTTVAGIYVSPSDIGGNTRESFVVEHNTIQRTGGVYMDLHPTTGTYTTLENTLL